MDIGRMHRIMRLLVMLQAGAGTTRDELMEQLDVSRRTLFRDLDVLRAAGIPVYHDRTHGYRIHEKFYLKPVNLSVPETLGLMLLTKQVSGRRHEPLMGPALSAIYKLVTTVPEPLRSACSEIMSHVSVDPAPVLADSRESDLYGKFSKWIDERRKVMFHYCGPTDSETMQGSLKPYLLHYANRAWYVLGHSDVHDEVRMFKLIRFQSVEPTHQHFRRPANFSVERKLGDAWQMIPEGRIYEVELLFTAKVATNVAEVKWHKSQEHEILEDGSCRLKFRVDGLGEISWWVCGYADQVQVLKPRMLREKVRQMHERAVKLNR